MSKERAAAKPEVINHTLISVVWHLNRALPKGLQYEADLGELEHHRRMILKQSLSKDLKAN